jgi:hypothetical protein
MIVGVGVLCFGVDTGVGVGVGVFGVSGFGEFGVGCEVSVGGIGDGVVVVDVVCERV